MKKLIKFIIYIFYYFLSLFIANKPNTKKLNKNKKVALFAFTKIKEAYTAGDASILEFILYFTKILSQKKILQINIKDIFRRESYLIKYKIELIVTRDPISFVIIDLLRKIGYFDLKLIYYATDIFYLRINFNDYYLFKILLKNLTFALEKNIWKNADYIFVNRKDEMDIISLKNKNISLVPAKSRLDLKINTNSPQEGAPINFIFVGSSGNVPNRVSINRFLEEYWKSILFYFPKSRLKIVGKEWDSFIPKTNGVSLLGFLSEKELYQEYQDVHFSIGYLEYGAGVKGKVLESMEHKTIILGNEVGFAGIECEALKPFKNFSELKNLINWYLIEDNYQSDINLYASFLRKNYNNKLIKCGIKDAIETFYEKGESYEHTINL